jgi:hypothetical protein
MAGMGDLASMHLAPAWRTCSGRHRSRQAGFCARWSSAGIRFALWDVHLMGVVDVPMPLDDAGPRASAVPPAGVEATLRP